MSSFWQDWQNHSPGRRGRWYIEPSPAECQNCWPARSCDTIWEESTQPFIFNSHKSSSLSRPKGWPSLGRQSNNRTNRKRKKKVLAAIKYLKKSILLLFPRILRVLNIAVFPIRNPRVLRALHTSLSDLPKLNFPYSFFLDQQNISLVDDDSPASHVKHRVRHHHVFAALEQPAIKRYGLSCPTVKSKTVHIHQIWY